MPKFKVGIKWIEHYEAEVEVDAPTLEEANNIAEQSKWDIQDRAVENDELGGFVSQDDPEVNHVTELKED